MKNVLVLGEKFPKDDQNNIISIVNLSDINLKVTNSHLLVFLNGKGWIEVDFVIWRLLSKDNLEAEYQIINLINYSNTPCINNPSSILNFSNRLNVKRVVDKNGILSNEFQVYYGNLSKLLVETDTIPAVIKVGDFHSGYGKFLIRDLNILSDINDFSTLVSDYVTIEKYIDYEIDIRCLVIGDRKIFIHKESKNWKANVGTFRINIIPPIPEIEKYCCEIKELLQADVIGIDWIRNRNGQWIFMEANLVPDLSCGSLDIERENKIQIIDLLVKKNS